MKKSLFLSLIVGLCAFAACSEPKLEPAEDQAFKPVANPDFVISSGTTTFVNTFATKADSNLEPVVTEGSVEANLSVCAVEGKQYVASKTTVHIRMGNEVTVFLPVATDNFSANDKSAVNVFKETQTRTGGWGENYAYFEIDAYGNEKKVEAKVDYITEGTEPGIKITVKGVDDDLARYLWEGYKDGLTVEVWNYYKDITLDDLKAGFDANATIEFSVAPDRYVNAFAKIPEYTGVITTELEDVNPSEPYYNDIGEDKKFWVPYKADGTLLETDFWVRPADVYGDESSPVIAPSHFYLLKGHKNPNDCVLAPAGFTYSSKKTHNADIPDDVDTVFYVIPGDYDVIYIK